MTESESEMRMAQNEVVFREANQQIQIGLDLLKRIAHEENEPHDEFDRSMPLNFICECSDENCRKRLTLTLDEYNNARNISEKCFVLANDHEVEDIEDVIETHDTYIIVKKHKMVPQYVDGLKRTLIDNTRRNTIEP